MKQISIPNYMLTKIIDLLYDSLEGHQTIRIIVSGEDDGLLVNYEIENLPQNQDIQDAL